jgi:hypothetical protein
MVRRRRTVPSFALLALLGAGTHLAAVEVSALGADGAWHRGNVGADAANLTVGTAVIPLDRLVVARFPATSPASAIDQGVVLNDGDVIAGVVVGMQNGQVEVAGDLVGNKTLPASAITALVLAAAPLRDLAHLGTEPGGVRFANGDRLAGTLTFLNANNAGIDTGKRIVEIPRERLALVRLAGNGARAATTHVRLATGERLSGKVRRADAKTLELEHPLLGAVVLPIALVTTVWSDGGALTALSSLPFTANQAGFLGPAGAATADRTRAGGSLQVQDGSAERGVWTSARSELVWTLDGSAERLVVEVGLDPAQARRGDAVVRVLGDGKPLAEVPLAGGAATVVNVPLAGVRQLTLVTDIGPDGTSTGDHVAWCWPVLVRGAP